MSHTPSDKARELAELINDIGDKFYDGVPYDEAADAEIKAALIAHFTALVPEKKETYNIDFPERRPEAESYNKGLAMGWNLHREATLKAIKVKLTKEG